MAVIEVVLDTKLDAKVDDETACESEDKESDDKYADCELIDASEALARLEASILSVVLVVVPVVELVPDPDVSRFDN